MSANICNNPQIGVNLQRKERIVFSTRQIGYPFNMLHFKKGIGLKACLSYTRAKPKMPLNGIQKTD